MFLQRLDVLNLNDKDVTRLGSLDLEWASQVVNPCEIHVLHVVGGIIVANLASGPIHALYLDCLAGLDGAGEWDCSGLVEANAARDDSDILSGCQRFCFVLAKLPLTAIDCLSERFLREAVGLCQRPA